ncbi:MAG TPA: hypothetical protein VF860_01120, partial [Candidatus Acidoferrales bacterium]
GIGCCPKIKGGENLAAFTSRGGVLLEKTRFVQAPTASGPLFLTRAIQFDLPETSHHSAS